MSDTNGLVDAFQQTYTLVDVDATNATGAAAKMAQVSCATASLGRSTGGSSATSSDRASLRTAGNLIAKALTGSDVRAGKVAALQQQIASGTYNVPASKVADRLISTLSN